MDGSSAKKIAERLNLREAWEEGFQAFLQNTTKKPGEKRVEFLAVIFVLAHADYGVDIQNKCGDDLFARVNGLVTAESLIALMSSSERYFYICREWEKDFKNAINYRF